MNFKLLFFLAILTGCGVKGGPVPPARTTLPSVESRYLEEIQTEEEDKKKDQKQNTKNVEKQND